MKCAKIPSLWGERERERGRGGRWERGEGKGGFLLMPIQTPLLFYIDTYILNFWSHIHTCK